MYRVKAKMLGLFLLLGLILFPFVPTTQLIGATPDSTSIIAAADNPTTRRWQPYNYRADYSNKRAYKYSNEFYYYDPTPHHYYQSQRDYPYYYYYSNPQLYYEGNDNGGIYFYRG